MLYLKRLSIRNKLTAIILSVTVLALLTSYAFYLYYAFKTSRQALLNQMEVTARLISEYSVSPIIFDHQRGAEEIILKLKSLPEIHHAAILKDDNSLFAHYHAVEVAVDHELQDLMNTDKYYHVSTPIIYQQDVYGTVHLMVPKSYVRDQLKEDLIYLSVIFIVATIMSVFLANILQRYISVPVSKLADFTEEVSIKNDYSLRADHDHKDEIGYLYNRFNHLLEQIQRERENLQRINSQLHESKENYQNLFQNSMVGIFRIDFHTGVIRQANQRTWEIFGAPPNYDKTIFTDFTNTRNLLKLRNLLLKQPFVENEEIKFKRPDGHTVWISVTGKLKREEEYFEGVIQDITESKRNYLELQKVNFELDNFVYHASHDLRSPLRTILGLVHISKLEKSRDKVEPILTKIETSIKRLDKLITDLLTFSRNGRMKGEINAIDIKRQIEMSLDQVDQLKLSAINVTINAKIDCPFESDPVRVSVVINNLISNAVKYQREDNPKKYIKINIHVDSKTCMLSVEDNGEGIPRESMSRIFDMFYRASESSEGSGLGLYIVHNVLDKLGGKIDIQSNYMQGTEVTVMIPNLYDQNIMSSFLKTKLSRS